MSNVNDNAPAIGSDGGGAAASISIAENGTVVTTVAASDADAGTTIAYSIAGGADAALFAIDGASGALSFKAAPDFEAPADADHNNQYQVTVQASDGSLTDSQAITVAVSNVNDNAPVIGSDGGGAAAAVSVAENGTAVTTVQASDADAGTTLGYSITGGADAALFAIDAATGALSFKSAPDFETPADADHNNQYEVTVTASDGTLTGSQAITVAVANVNEAPTNISLDNSSVDASSAVGSVVGSLSATDPDADDALAYTLINDVGGEFKIVGDKLEVAGNLSVGAHDIVVRVADFGNLTFNKAFSIDVTVPPITVASSPPAGAVLNAGKSLTITIDVSNAVIEPVTVTGTPTLSLNDNATAAFDEGASDLAHGILAFSYKVAAGQNTGDLQVFEVNLAGGAINDANGQPIDFSGIANSDLGLIVDTLAPTVTGVTGTPGSGAVGAGQTVVIDVMTSEAVQVNGGTPILTLSDKGIAIYDEANSDPANGKLEFDYTVGVKDSNTPDLKVAGLTLAKGVTITDLAGNAINPAASKNADLGIAVDSIAPAVKDGLKTDTGASKSDKITADATLTGSGDAQCHGALQCGRQRYPRHGDRRRQGVVDHGGGRSRPERRRSHGDCERDGCGGQCRLGLADLHC